MTTQGSGEFAVVTGASCGIGLELARQLAEHGHDLLLCAEDDGLAKVAAELGAHGTTVDTVRSTTVDTVQTDLRTADGVRELYRAITEHGGAVGALVLNAGVGRGDAFIDQPIEDVLSVVELNVTSTVHLARLVLPDMVRRNRGRVLITSSIASMMPGAYQAVYNASKSFLQSFTQALQIELASSAVTVTSLMPGPTETNFFERAEMADSTPIGRSSKDDPATVAAQGYQAMMAGKRRVVGGGVSTRLQYWAGIVTPDIVKSAMHGVMAKPRPARRAG